MCIQFLKTKSHFKLLFTIIMFFSSPLLPDDLPSAPTPPLSLGCMRYDGRRCKAEQGDLLTHADQPHLVCEPAHSEGNNTGRGFSLTLEGGGSSAVASLNSAAPRSDSSLWADNTINPERENML